jgi:hypothetical protein
LPTCFTRARPDPICKEPSMHMGGPAMQAIDIQEHARKLHAAHGDRAAVEAAQKAKAYEEQGSVDEARTWRRIERALRELQGPRVS